MASLAYDTKGLRIAVIVMLIYSFTFSPSTSVGSQFFRGSEGTKQMKMVLGSRPPQCVNRCMSCKPCMAALVTPPHHDYGFSRASSKGDETYYLLLWKCKCGDKYFQP